MGKNTEKWQKSQHGNNKDGLSAPNPHSIPNREAFQRISYLYQATAYLNSVDALRQPQIRGQKNHLQTVQGFDGHAINVDPTSEPNGMNVNEVAASTSGHRVILSSVNASGVNSKNVSKVATLNDLGARYVSDLRVIGNKSVVRIDPSVKRKLCKSCNAVLIPGTTASVRIKRTPNRYNKRVNYTCLHCKAFRSIPATSFPKPVKPTDVWENENAPDSSAHQAVPGDNAGRNGELSQKHQRILFSERRDAGHMMVIGNEMAPFE